VNGGDRRIVLVGARDLMAHQRLPHLARHPSRSISTILDRAAGIDVRVWKLAAGMSGASRSSRSRPRRGRLDQSREPARQLVELLRLIVCGVDLGDLLTEEGTRGLQRAGDLCTI
jgi:hypothetical protein